MSEKKDKVQHDIDIRRNLSSILKEFGAIMTPTVVVSSERQKLVEDIAALLDRLPMNKEQVALIYEAICRRMISKVCYKCARLRPMIDGVYIWHDGDMSKPKRFVCGECK
jgi:hypothetical protein